MSSTSPPTVPHCGMARCDLAIRTIAMPADANPFGHIFGGWLMAQMDLAGGTTASFRAKGRCATVAVEAMKFHKPVFIGDEVTCYTEIVRVGRTSITVRIEAWVRRKVGGAPERVTEGLFTFVAVDDVGQPRPVPSE
jgi:acyl-CoA thioesterase YciA